MEETSIFSNPDPIYDYCEDNKTKEKHLTEFELMQKGYTKITGIIDSKIINCKRRRVLQFDEHTNLAKSEKIYTAIYDKTSNMIYTSSENFECYVKQYNDGINLIQEHIYPIFTKEFEDTGYYLILIKSLGWSETNPLFYEDAPAFYHKDYTFEYVYIAPSSLIGNNWRDNVKTILTDTQNKYTFDFINSEIMKKRIISGFSYCADVTSIDLGDVIKSDEIYSKSNKEILSELFSLGIFYHTEYRPDYIHSIDWFRASLLKQTKESLIAYKNYLDMDLLKISNSHLVDLIEG